MNRQNLDRKEVRLGTAQIVGILGLTIGSIFAAFGLGFYTGRNASFEREVSNALDSLPKLPVGEEDGEGDLGEKIVSEVYAKLNEQKEGQPAAGSALEDENAFPELGTIEEAEGLPKEAEEIEEVELEKLPETPAGGTIADIKPTPAPDLKPVEKPTEKPLEKPTNKPAEKTLAETKGKPQPTSVPEKPKAEKSPEPVKTEKPKVEKTPEPVKTEKPKEDKKTTSNILVPQKPPTGWYAQIAAPKDVADATSMASSLKKAGFQAVIETADVRGEKYYRVIVGPEKSKTQADVLLKQLKREPYISGDPFLRMVK